MNRGENLISFRISDKGEVKFDPEVRIQSTSHEMQLILQEIVPKVAKYIESLLREKLG